MSDAVGKRGGWVSHGSEMLEVLPLVTSLSSGGRAFFPRDRSVACD